jgi:hypothetical protein
MPARLLAEYALRVPLARLETVPARKAKVGRVRLVARGVQVDFSAATRAVPGSAAPTLSGAPTLLAAAADSSVAEAVVRISETGQPVGVAADPASLRHPQQT